MELPVLPGPNPKLLDVIKGVAELKIRQDYMSRTLVGQQFLNDWMHAASTCAFFPDTFVRRLLPFLLWEEERSRKTYPALVPVEFAIGACIKGLPYHIEPEEVPDRIAQYRENKASGARASGTYIPELGIYFAHEGKHRVAFMRHHNEPFFQAEVDDLSYPAADRLKIVTSSRSKVFFVLLDERYLQLLLLPHSTQRILSSYGVSSIRWDQLNDAPAESTVLRMVGERQLFTAPDNRSEATRTIDLHELLQKEDTEKQRERELGQKKATWKNRFVRFLLNEPD